MDYGTLWNSLDGAIRVMKSIDIFSLTRVRENHNIKRLDRQMSGRGYFLNIKNWEIDCLRAVADKLSSADVSLQQMNFYYSFQIPKLGKEFDLLKITDEYVINIELKSKDVPDEKIRRQLLQNRYYLATLGRTIRSYTYILSQDRLVRLSNSEKLVDTDFEKLAEEIQNSGLEYAGDIEELFKEENYIVSPLTDPERFLQREYFLTSQQHDIRSRILKHVKEASYSFQGFTGLPGTGKTLLLYDIAMELSKRQKVCVLHFGSCPEELEKLDDRLKRIDFYKCRGGRIQGEGALDALGAQIPLDDYEAILVDEGHRITGEFLSFIKAYAIDKKLPVIISYDSEDAIAPAERANDPALDIERLPEFYKFKLTNRIRMNAELSSFINCLMHPARYRRRSFYPNISVAYGNTKEEAERLIGKFIDEGYIYISKRNLEDTTDNSALAKDMVSSHMATCQEFGQVVMRISRGFYYDEEGYLRYEGLMVNNVKDESPVRALFHGLNRGKNKIAIVVVDNEPVLDEILYILQGD